MLQSQALKNETELNILILEMPIGQSGKWTGRSSEGRPCSFGSPLWRDRGGAASPSPSRWSSGWPRNCRLPVRVLPQQRSLVGSEKRLIENFCQTRIWRSVAQQVYLGFQFQRDCFVKYEASVSMKLRTWDSAWPKITDWDWNHSPLVNYFEGN